jgi:hypothetical protein
MFARALVLLGCLTSLCATVLMEVSFDLALHQESDTGYTASHTVEEYLKDPHLLWLRYLNTLASGVDGTAPMRTAFLEFKDYHGWATFETTNLERTHILYDLFWINWRKVLWEDAPALTIPAPERTDEKPGGYLYGVRYSVREDQREAGARFVEEGLRAIDVKAFAGFVERRGFTNGLWQSRYSHLVWFEFESLDALSKAIFQDPAVRSLFTEAKAKYLTEYAASILVPSAGSQGGQFFKGGASSPGTEDSL